MSIFLEDALLEFRRFLATENPWKVTKNDFYFMLKALLVLQIFTFLSWHFGYVKRQSDDDIWSVKKI